MPPIAVAPVATTPPAPTPTVRPTIRQTPRPADPLWTAHAIDHRGANGERFDYVCPPDGTFGEIWGTDTYTDDSSVCTAAVHRGVITREEGGAVTIVIRPGLREYTGSTRNGVTTAPYDAWDGSYEIVVGAD